MQKGLQYLELEANLNDNGGENGEGNNEEEDIDANFSVLTARDLLSKPVDALKALVKSRREMSAEERKRAIEEEENALKRKLEERKKAAMAVKTIDGTFAGGGKNGVFGRRESTVRREPRRSDDVGRPLRRGFRVRVEPKERRAVSQWQRRRDGENLDVTGWAERESRRGFKMKHARRF